MPKDWKSELREYFFSPVAEKLNIEAAMEIKKRHIPERLFKFRAVSKNSLDNFFTDTVWCNNAKEFNDPYDSYISISHDEKSSNETLINAWKQRIPSGDDAFVSKSELNDLSNSENPMKDTARKTNFTKDQQEEIYHLTEKIIDDHFKEMNQKFNESVQQGYKISSFSERIDSILMWSHYSNFHTEFAIEYNFSDIPVTDIQSRILWPVLYEEKLFDASPFIKEQQLKGKFNNLFGIIASIHKCIDWSYEKEWRYVLPMGPEDPPQNFRVPKPVALYLGVKIDHSDQLVQRIENHAKSRGIKLFKMELSQSEYKMIPNIYE